MTMILEDETVPLLGAQLPLFEEQTRIKKSKATIWHILAPVFLVVFCTAAMAAPTYELYTLIFCKRYYESIGDFSFVPIEKCAIPEVQSKVSWVAGIDNTLIYGAGMLVASFYGSLSDRKGRVFVIRISNIGFLFFATTFIFMSWFPGSNFTLFLIFFGPLLNGLMAGGSVTMGAVQAYLSDCTLISERTLVFSYYLSAAYLGGTLGPICSSFLIKHTGKLESVYYGLFLIYSILSFYSMFILPESLDLSAIKSDDSNNSDNNDTSPIKTEINNKETKTLLEKLNIFSSLKIFYQAKLDCLIPWAGIILAIIYMLILSSEASPPYILYGMLRFGWSSYEGGVYLSITSVSKLIVATIILPFLTKKFNTGSPKFDIWMVRFATITDLVCFLLSGLASSTAQYTIANALACFAIASQPSLLSLLTSMVKPTQVGQLMGAISIIEGISIILSQLGLKGLYSATVAFMPNLVFFVCSFLSLIAILLSLSLRILSNRRVDIDV